MNFVRQVKSSLYDPVFYGGLAVRPLGSSVKYFFLLVAVLAFIIAFVAGSRLSPFFSAESLKKIAGLYPSELAVTLKNGAVSTNVSEPYFISFAEEDGALVPKNARANFAVIDTKNDFSRELFKRYDASFWLGKDFVVSVKNSGQLELTDLGRMPDFTLNHEKLLSWADKIGSYHLAVSFAVFLALFLSFCGFFIFKLVWLLIMAFIVWLVGKIRKMDLSYKNSFKAVLHAATIPFILAAVFVIGGVSQPFVFFFSLILLLIAFANLKKSRGAVA